VHIHSTQDLSRTFPGHKVFASKKGREPLKRVLTAYAWKNSSIGSHALAAHTQTHAAHDTHRTRAHTSQGTVSR